MVYNKYYRDTVGGKNHLRPREEWKIHKNHHEAIISRDFFEKVQGRQKQTGNKTRRIKEHRHPLQGKVFCGGCKRAMTIRKGGVNPYFFCNRRYVYAETENCVAHVNLLFLEQWILYKMNAELCKEGNAGNMKLKKEEEAKEQMYILAKEKEALTRKKAVLQRKRREEYEKAVFGKKSEFQTEDISMRKIEEKMVALDCIIDELGKKLSKSRDGIEAFFNSGYGGELTAELVEALIQKIIVYDEEHMEIEWKFETEDGYRRKPGLS